MRTLSTLRTDTLARFAFNVTCTDDGFAGFLRYSPCYELNNRLSNSYSATVQPGGRGNSPSDWLQPSSPRLAPRQSERVGGFGIMYERAQRATQNLGSSAPFKWA